MDSENSLDDVIVEAIDDVSDDEVLQEDAPYTPFSAKSENLTGISGDDEIFYNKESTDYFISQVDSISDDFSRWLYDIEQVDEVFDSVIYPYYKGNPPKSQRFSQKKNDFFSALEAARKDFDDTLDEILEYIVDYSNDKTLSLDYVEFSGNTLTESDDEISDLETDDSSKDDENLSDLEEYLDSEVMQ